MSGLCFLIDNFCWSRVVFLTIHFISVKYKLVNFCIKALNYLLKGMFW